MEQKYLENKFGFMKKVPILQKNGIIDFLDGNHILIINI